jgi:hypothetical protein
MDLYTAIRELYIEKQRLDRTIAALEELKSAQAGVAALPYERRGRKSMGTGERQEASERMKRYWANRRRSRKSVARDGKSPD